MIYDRSKNTRYLDEAIRYCEQAVDYMMYYDTSGLSTSWQRTYGRRKSLLASLFFTRYSVPDFEIGGDDLDIRNALTLQASAAGDILGDIDSYTQFSSFCNSLMEKAGVDNNVRYIDDAIWLRSFLPKKMLSPGDDDLDFSQNNYCENSELLCRRWQMTGTDCDFDKIIEGSRELVQFEIQREKPRDYILDPNNPLHVLRIVAINLAIDIGAENSRWTRHIPTYDTAIALFLKLTNLLPMSGTTTSLLEREFPIHATNYIMEKRFQLTHTPTHGFALDDMNIHCAQHNATQESLKTGLNLLTNPTGWSTFGISAVTGQEFWCFDPPTVPLRPPRFLFLDPVSPETWIRRRNDDGTLELGATTTEEDDTDADIWEFCRGYGEDRKRIAERAREYLRRNNEVVATVNSEMTKDQEVEMVMEMEREENAVLEQGQSISCQEVVDAESSGGGGGGDNDVRS